MDLTFYEFRNLCFILGTDFNIRKRGNGIKNMQMRAQSISAQLTIDKENGYRVALEMKAFV